MEKAGIKAAALNENTSQKDASKALRQKDGAHLIFASPEYLLHNPRMKKLYADEEARKRVLGVLVDEGHVIHEWADNFRKDFRELNTLRVILGNDVPWWVLSATFTNRIFKTVYETLSFGTSRPFWGIDVGTERPNLAQYVRPMESAATSYLSLIPFIPAGAQTEDDIPKTIIFFRSIAETRDACLAIKALLPPHLHPSIQPFAAPDEEETKEKRLQGLKEGRIRMLCCTIAAGMGCDIPDIKVAVIYGVDSFVSFVQKGGRAGRDGKAGARIVWLVEDWMFQDKGGGKRMEERRAKVDPMTSEYIHRQRTGSCLRDFTREVFRPEPEKLDLPGFGGKQASKLEVSWVVKGEKMSPGPGECCSASSCREPGSDLNAGFLTETEKAAAESRHHLILKVLKSETSASEAILGPPPGNTGIHCPNGEKVAFQEALEKWRDDYWKSVCGESPMLSRAWVLGEGNIKRLVKNLRRIINTDREKIDRKWFRALITTASTDEAVDSLLVRIQRFHDEFFARLKERNPRTSKQQKTSYSTSQQRPPSPAASTFTQDSYCDPDYPPPQSHGSGASSSQSNRKRARRSGAIVQAGASSLTTVRVLTTRPKQALPQPASRQQSPQSPFRLTRLTQMLPEPMLVSHPPLSHTPLAHVPTRIPRQRQQLDPALAAAPPSPWHTSNTIHISHPPSLPMQISHSSLQPDPMGTPPRFLYQLHPPHHAQPPSFPVPATVQGTQFAIPSQSTTVHSQQRFHAPRSPRSFSQPSAHPYNPHFPLGSQNQYSQPL